VNAFSNNKSQICIGVPFLLRYTNVIQLSSKKVGSKTPQHQYSIEQNGPILWTNNRTNSPQNARFDI